MSEDKRIFDDFPKVNCNGCEHYYTNSCDGVSKGSNKPCKTFLATRNTDILHKIKSLTTQIKVVYIIVVAELISIVILGSMIF